MTREHNINRAVETNRQAMAVVRVGIVINAIAIGMNLILGNLPMILLGVGAMILLSAATIIIRRNNRNAAELQR